MFPDSQPQIRYKPYDNLHLTQMLAVLREVRDLYDLHRRDHPMKKTSDGAAGIISVS